MLRRSLFFPLPILPACLAGLLLAMCLLAPVPVAAQHLILDKLVLDNRSGNVAARFTTHIDDISRIEEELADGAELGLIARVTLSRQRTAWVDATLAEREMVTLMGYDPLSKEYLVSPPLGGKEAKGKDLGLLLEKFWRDAIVELAPWSGLERGHDYVLDLEIRLTRKDVPGWIRTTLFFWSWDVIGVTTYRLEFSY